MRDVNRKQGQNRSQRKHSFHRTLQKWHEKIQNIRLRCLQKSEGLMAESESTEEPIDNPWINDTRKIVEQILMKKDQTYRRFRPLIIDTDTPDQVFGEEDDVDRILRQLYPGLNFLELCTDRPEHFAEMTEWLAAEYGLLTQILPLKEMRRSRAGMVLDLQRQGELHIQKFARDVIYVPFYKRRWRECQKTEQEKSQEEQEIQKMTALSEKRPENTERIQGQNLDIEVPIGYNVVIVKVDKTLQNY